MTKLFYNMTKLFYNMTKPMTLLNKTKLTLVGE